MKKLILVSFLAGLLFISCIVKKNLTIKENGYSPDVALKWINLLTELSRKTPYSPGPTVRIFVYSSLAMYEAGIPVSGQKSIFKYLTKSTIPFQAGDYHWPSCINAALGSLVPRLISIYPVNHDLPAIDSLHKSFDSLFNKTVDKVTYKRSVEFGKIVADSLYQWGLKDGTVDKNGNLVNCPPYNPGKHPGNWSPTPPDYLPAVGNCQGSLRPFLPDLNIPVTPHPIYSTDPGSIFYKDAENLVLSGFHLTKEDSMLIHAWRDLKPTNYNPPSHILKLTLQILAKEKADLQKTCLVLATHCMAVYDAIIHVFREKYKSELLRPVSYIQNSMGKKDWLPVIPTPWHPAYPSTVVGSSAAAVAVLEHFFGREYSFTDSTQSALYGRKEYSSFTDLLSDVGRSRTLAGINYQFSVDAAIQLGRSVGEVFLKLPVFSH